MSDPKASTPAAGGPRLHRHLLVAGLGAALAVALLAVVVLAGGGDDEAPSGPPAGAALALVPADALVALQLSTDGGRPAVRRAGKVASRLPSWPKLRESLLARVDARGCGIDLRRDDGDEIVFALLPGRRGVAAPLLVTDAPASGLDGETPQPCGALVARRVGDLVAIGEAEALRAAAAVAAGNQPALVDAPDFRRAAAGLPRERVLSGWASLSGTRRLLKPLGGLLGTLGGLADTPGLQGAAAALVATSGGAKITINRVARRRGEAPAFTPTLQRYAPADALSYTASGDLAGGLQRLLVLSGKNAAAALDELLDRRDPPLVRLSRQVRESAFVVSPGAEQPSVTLLARVRDPEKAGAALRRLEPELAGLVGAPAGAQWADARLGGPARRLDAGPAGLAYGFAGDVLALSTTASAVSAARSRSAPLENSEAYRSVLSESPPRVTSLVFLDPNQLLRLGADTGTGLEDALQDVSGDLARVRAIGVTASGTGESSTVELSLSIP